MTRPAVSVVLPTYNGERYLAASIESVLSQSFEDFELLIWDDCSGDGSWDLIRRYRDERVRSRRHETNRGLFRNLNDAITHARGDLVRLWSQDDVMKSHCLSEEQLFWRTHPGVGLFYCQREIIDENGRPSVSVERDETPASMTGRLADDISFHWGSMPGNISTVSLPRDVLEDVGLFSTEMTLAADFELWTRIQAKYRIGFVNQALISLRDHPKQLSRSLGSELLFLRECREIYRRLHERLPDETRRARERYSRHVHGAHFFHAAVRALLSARPRYACTLAKEVHRWHNVAMVALLWLVSGNTRFFRPSPAYSAESRRALGLESDPAFGGVAGQ